MCPPLICDHFATLITHKLLKLLCGPNGGHIQSIQLIHLVCSQPVCDCLVTGGTGEIFGTLETVEIEN